MKTINICIHAKFDKTNNIQGRYRLSPVFQNVKQEHKILLFKKKKSYKLDYDYMNYTMYSTKYFHILTQLKV